MITPPPPPQPYYLRTLHCESRDGSHGVDRPLVTKNVSGSVNTIPFNQSFVNSHQQQLPSLVTLDFSSGTNPRGLFLCIDFKPCFELLPSCYCPSWHIINCTGTPIWLCLRNTLDPASLRKNMRSKERNGEKIQEVSIVTIPQDTSFPPSS